MFLLSILPGLVLLFLSLLFVAVFIRQLLTDPNALLGLMLVGLILGFVWYLWMQLPGFFRKFIHKAISKGGKHDKAKH
jgi:predicted acyltransferase